jgi:hypothetical protein
MQQTGLINYSLDELLIDLNSVANIYSQHGCLMLSEVYSSYQMTKIGQLLQERLVSADSNSVRQREGQVYAARNVLTLCPEIVDLWKTTALIQLLITLLGKETGLVRALYFDKPPAQSWSLPWHKDVLIAVKSPVCQSPRYSPIRNRLGVPHCEPPLDVLQSMLTLRLHIDEVTEENGPLEVMLNSHQQGKEILLKGLQHETVYSPKGGLFVMHRLIAHASGKSYPETKLHRRILHLEFASSSRLPDDYEWFEFYPLDKK